MKLLPLVEMLTK